MPRSIEMILPPDRTPKVVAALQSLEPLSLRVYAGAGVNPPGDVLAVEVSNRRLQHVMRIADACGAGDDQRVSVSTSRPSSLVSAGRADGVVQDSDTATAEEIELAVGQESTMTIGKVFIMFVAGAFAALGLASGALHLLIGAMVIAPGFEPFSRLGLGLAHRSRARRRGLIDIAKGYGALTAGGAGAGVLCRVFGDGWLNTGTGSYLPSETLQRYFSTTSWTSVAVALLGGVAGALLLVVNRRVLTAGVMIALGLIPAFAIAGMAVVAGDWSLTGMGLARGAVDAVAVTVMSVVVFRWHRHTTRRRTRV